MWCTEWVKFNSAAHVHVSAVPLLEDSKCSFDAAIHPIFAVRACGYSFVNSPKEYFTMEELLGIEIEGNPIIDHPYLAEKGDISLDPVNEWLP